MPGNRTNPKSSHGRKVPTPFEAERQAKAIEYRKAGMGYEQIATALGCSRSSAFRNVAAGLRFYLAEHGAEEVGAAMQVQLDAAIRAIWPKVLVGDLLAIDRLIKIQTRQAALLGTDQPTKVALSGQVKVVTVDGLTEAIAEAEAKLADNPESAGIAHPG